MKALHFLLADLLYENEDCLLNCCTPKKPLETNILSVLLQTSDHLEDHVDSHREGKPVKGTAVEVFPCIIAEFSM